MNPCSPSTAACGSDPGQHPTLNRPSQPVAPAGSVSGSVAAAEDAGLPEAASQQGEAGSQMQRETGPHYHARHPGRRMMEARKRSFDALSEASCVEVLQWGGTGRLMPLASEQQQLMACQQLSGHGLADAA